MICPYYKIFTSQKDDGNRFLVLVPEYRADNKEIILQGFIRKPHRQIWHRRPPVNVSFSVYDSLRATVHMEKKTSSCGYIPGRALENRARAAEEETQRDATGADQNVLPRLEYAWRNIIKFTPVSWIHSRKCFWHRSFPCSLLGELQPQVRVRPNPTEQVFFIAEVSYTKAILPQTSFSTDRRMSFQRIQWTTPSVSIHHRGARIARRPSSTVHVGVYTSTQNSHSDSSNEGHAFDRCLCNGEIMSHCYINTIE